MVAEVLRRWCEHSAERTAMIEAETGRSRTFAQVDADSNRVATALSASGVRRGDRVVYYGLNRIEFFELYFACDKIGAVLCPLNWTLPADQIVAVILDLDAKVAVVDPEFRDRVHGDLVVRVIGVDYQLWRDDHAASNPEILVRPEDPVLQPYTSGTTGMPKGVQLTHGNLASCFDL